MTLSSAIEDLRATTLKTIVGGLRKLEYLGGLRAGGGTYVHWGLARVHGEIAADQALAEEHHFVTSHVLAMPIRILLEDLEQSSQQAGMAATEYVERLSGQGASLLPAELCSGAELHLSSALRALSCLLKAHPPSASRLTV